MKIYHWLKKKVYKIYEQPTLVLMYHRVGQPEVDPWKLSVSPLNFEQQLQVLKKTGLVAPSSQLIEQVNAKNVKRSRVVLTFDDGYADNFEVAKPILEKYELPATFFISTKHIDQYKEFWWDELARILLQTSSLPRHLNLNLNGTRFYFDLQTEETLTEVTEQKIKLWNAYLEPTTLRAQLYIKLWKLLSPLPYAEQQEVLSNVRDWGKIPNQPCISNFSMTLEQLRELSRNKLFEIGSHTVSHPALACYCEEEQRVEIAESKRFLEFHTNSIIQSFAYPSGNYNETTLQILKQLSFQIAFTTHDVLVNKHTDPYQIGRFQVNNWTKDEMKKNLYSLF
ncbi:polysaccharide deacetylase family protein [Adhaeribacter radiodurans]|uniref:Polysaccharide deacetylase family protein n=1 Tax=Adhaeribacter radiodurans TaxID=2745197 RepID=A0A7L7L4Y8_9BACT|nr:polysaccharide deacetylase family protein [Adhaeribacter radiodurans]QMU27449.1 polysaccharide deacetylase family protein [Adhaeribacter radiodurans]